MMESPDEDRKKASANDQNLATADSPPSSSSTKGHKLTQPAHPTMTPEEVMHELRTMQEHEHRCHMHFMSVYQPANRLGLQTLLPPPLVVSHAAGRPFGTLLGRFNPYGRDYRQPPGVMEREPVREMDLFHAEDCCNKSTAVYILRQPPPASLDSGVADARLRMLLIVVHVYLYKRWFEPYRSEVEWGRFIAKTIVPVIGCGSTQSVDLGSLDTDMAVSRLHQAVYLASTRTRLHVARRHGSPKRLAKLRQQRDQLLRLTQPSTPQSQRDDQEHEHELELELELEQEDSPESEEEGSEDEEDEVQKKEDKPHSGCHPDDDRQFRRQVLERGLDPARALLNKRNYVLQPLFRAVAITIRLEDHKPEHMRSGGDAGAIPVRIVLFDNEDDDDDDYDHHLSAPLSFEPIQDRIHDYREAQVGDGDGDGDVGQHKTRSAATTLDTAAGYILAMAQREEAAQGLHPDPVEASIDGEDGCLLGEQALRRAAAWWGQPDVDISGPSSLWVDEDMVAERQQRQDHHPDRARGAASDDEAWMARLEAAAYDNLRWREGKLPFPPDMSRKKKKDGLKKEESWVSLKDCWLW